MTLHDRDLQGQVLAALDREPGVDAAHIGVSVTDGIVTLRGVVASLDEQWRTERAAHHIFGVRAVANDLDVAPLAAWSDSAVAYAAANALEWDGAIPDSAVKVTVRNGWITLMGTVARPYQKATAERVVQRLYGVRGVANAIIVKPEASIGESQRKSTRAGETC